MSGTAAQDPRVEPVMDELNRCQQAVAFGRGNAGRLLTVADAADRAAGVIRVRVDDATEALHGAVCDRHLTSRHCREFNGKCVRARAVLEALVTP